MNSDVLTIGNPTGNELSTPRINVRGVIFDPKANKFCFVVMDENIPFLPGGGTDGEDLKTALEREIIEELGYTDFEIQDQLGSEIISYLENKKPTHRYVSDTGYLVKLNSQNQVKIQLSEEEKSRKLSHLWLTKEEIIKIWEQTEIPGYQRHKELFKRAVKKLNK